MISKIIGGTLLIIGTSIGAGMLALPVATAAGGFYHSLFLFISAWVVTVIAAYFILEVNLWLPEDTNLVSMAKETLGVPGQVVTWFCYLFLLYSLLSAYTAGGSDLLHTLFTLIGLQTPFWFDSMLFVLLLGGIVYFGIHVVDLANRGFMFVKLAAFFVLVALIVPHVQTANLFGGEISMLNSALMIVITSFGYATIIPSLRSYFKSDVKALRLTIMLGSLVSLVCYLMWDFAVQGAVRAQGPGGLVEMFSSTSPASDLTLALNSQLNPHLKRFADLFTSICLTTSFLGVGLCLSDFLSDGLHILKRNGGRLIITLLTFVPPLVLVLFYPGAFILGLKYAGIFCVILLILLPATMVWFGRYERGHLRERYQVWGGRALAGTEIVIGLALLVFGFIHL